MATGSPSAPTSGSTFHPTALPLPVLLVRPNPAYLLVTSSMARSHSSTRHVTGRGVQPGRARAGVVAVLVVIFAGFLAAPLARAAHAVSEDQAPHCADLHAHEQPVSLFRRMLARSTPERVRRGLVVGNESAEAALAHFLHAEEFAVRELDLTRLETPHDVASFARGALQSNARTAFLVRGLERLERKDERVRLNGLQSAIDTSTSVVTTSVRDGRREAAVSTRSAAFIFFVREDHPTVQRLLASHASADRLHEALLREWEPDFEASRELTPSSVAGRIANTIRWTCRWDGAKTLAGAADRQPTTSTPSFTLPLVALAVAAIIVVFVALRAKQTPAAVPAAAETHSTTHGATHFLDSATSSGFSGGRSSLLPASSEAGFAGHLGPDHVEAELMTSLDRGGGLEQNEDRPQAPSTKNRGRQRRQTRSNPSAAVSPDQGGQRGPSTDPSTRTSQRRQGRG